MTSSRIFIAASLLLLATCHSFAAEVQRPNIVVLLADDFGVGDIQAHYPDNKIPTPHLDRLVGQGMSFTDAHSCSAVCSPTRYGLLTGRYAWRTRLQEWVIAAYEPPLIAADRLTLPGLLRKQGYRTACIGKWHLGWEWPGAQPSRMVEKGNALWTETWDFNKRIAAGPIERGFDYFFGVDLPNLPPFAFIENERLTAAPTERYAYHSDQGVVMPRGFVGAPMAPGWQFDEILPEITQRALRYIRAQAKQPGPFFLYFSMTSPHEPVSPSRAFVGKSGIAPIADFVMETDWSAGQVIKAIDEAGLAQDTLLIFTADNGHSHYTGWEKLIAAGHLPSGPYRGHKGDIWEGGHRVPFIVRWPGRVAPGTSNDSLLCLNDILATAAELVGAGLPDRTAEDSFSFLSAMLGSVGKVARSRADGGLFRQSPGKSDRPFRRNLVSHSVNGEFAYREGPWKIVFKMPGPNRQKSRGRAALVELYDLDEDLTETNDLSARHPEIVKELSAKLRAVVDSGRSRPGGPTANDTKVRFDVIQTERWAAPLK